MRTADDPALARFVEALAAGPDLDGVVLHLFTVGADQIADTLADLDMYGAEYVGVGLRFGADVRLWTVLSTVAAPARLGCPPNRFTGERAAGALRIVLEGVPDRERAPIKLSERVARLLSE